MILFLNFIPIEFMGGTEKWIHDTAKKVHTHESTHIISMHPNIANIYGMLVLKRKYDSRMKRSEVHNYLSLDLQSFIPFTRKWKDTRDIFLQSRLIYTRYEIIEMFIVFFFSGKSGLKKTIAGVHAPYRYTDPVSFFDTVHNALYSSWIYTYIFQQVKKVHVLHTKDEQYVTNQFKLHNVLCVPNGADVPKTIRKKSTEKKRQLHVLFVGELSTRKGIDILISIITKTPEHIQFTIAGDGYLKKDIEALVKKCTHAQYQGYIDKDTLDSVYRKNDALILTSRAESMSLAVLEALSYGLVIIDSLDTMLGLDTKVEYVCSNNNNNTYVDTLEKLFHMKITNKLNKQYVKAYFKQNFSSPVVDLQVFNNIFEMYPI